MKQELEQIEYNDTLVALNSCFEQYGVREVLKDFRNSYPAMFEELVVQMTRLTPQAKVAALLRPPHVGLT
jgi:hypothetical protein